MEEILRQVPLFSTLDDKLLHELAVISEIRSYVKNTVIFNKGDAGDTLLVLLSGKLRVFLSHEDGREMTLSFLKPYGYLGEIALLDDAPRSASVQAIEKSSVCIIYKDRFKESLIKYPSMALALLQQMNRIIRRLTDEIDAISFQDVYNRVARKICSLADEEGIEKNGIVEINHNLTHQDLANMVGSARESVTKVLNSMETNGIIVMNRHKIIIKTPEKLKNI